MHNCVNNKMLEYMWLLTAPLSGLINCFKSELQEVHVSYEFAFMKVASTNLLRVYS